MPVLPQSTPLIRAEKIRQEIRVMIDSHHRPENLPADSAASGRGTAAGTSRARVPMHFQQSCPTCGRRLRILVQHLGWHVSCTHCGRTFVARDETQQADGGCRSLLDQVDRLLAVLESTH
jgi:hypothetical protein